MYPRVSYFGEFLTTRLLFLEDIKMCIRVKSYGRNAVERSGSWTRRVIYRRVKNKIDS